MDRQDGKDPFDPKTYNSPATIKSMVELRAFCAAFFEDHVRSGMKPIDEDLLTKFIALIISSKSFFARARAVIPELQLSIPSTDISHLESCVQRVLQMTEDLRRSPDKELKNLAEDSAWSKLAKDGQQQRAEAEGLTRDGRGHSRQASSVESPLRLGTPAQPRSKDTNGSKNQASSMSVPFRQSTSAANEPMELLGSGSLHASSTPDIPSTSRVGLGFRTKPSAIPTFIPQNQLGSIQPLVWSPTSGTRERRPEDFFQGSNHRSTDSTPFNQEALMNTPKKVKPHPILSSLKSETPRKAHGRAVSTDSIFVETEPYRSMPSPLGPGSPSFAQAKAETSFKRRVHKPPANIDFDPLTISEPELEVAHPSQEISEFMYETEFGNKQNWVPIPSKVNQRHPFNRTRENFGSESFSAPPNMPGFGDLHVPGQNPFGGPRSPPFLPQPGQDPRNRPRSPSFQLEPSQGQYGGMRDPSIQRQLGQPILDSESSNPPFQHQLDQLPQVRSTNPYSQPGPSFAPSPAIWGPTHSPLAPNTIQPPPPLQSFYPGFPTANHPPAPFPPTNENLTIPPPGSLPPLDYWNLLHQRTTEILTRLSAAQIPMTDRQRAYITALSEARIGTIASSRLPMRGNRNARSWLKILEGELSGIWEQRAGMMPETPVVVDRKRDYERAVLRELEFVEGEIGGMRRDRRGRV